MRKIEQQMNRAIARGINWTGGNTQVTQHACGCTVYLHGNAIADIDNDGIAWANQPTLLYWPTRTTMSRLRALGVDVCTRKGDVVLNGEVIS